MTTCLLVAVRNLLLSIWWPHFPLSNYGQKAEKITSFPFSVPCAPVHSLEVAVCFQFTFTLMCFAGFSLKSESFTFWQDEVTEMLQIFLEHISGSWKFAGNIFSLSTCSFTVIRRSFVPLNFLRALGCELIVHSLLLGSYQGMWSSSLACRFAKESHGNITNVHFSTLCSMWFTEERLPRECTRADRQKMLFRCNKVFSPMISAM